MDSDTDIDSLTVNDDINDIMTYSTNNDGHNSVTAVTSSQGTLGTEQNGATKKRRAIQEIMRDNNLSEIERRHKIQSLMDGSSQNTSVATSFPFSGASDSSTCFVANANGLDEPMSCVHYERKCNIVAPCCNRVFGCRVCHDEMTPFPGHGPMDRFKIKEVVCKDCNTRQSKSYVTKVIFILSFKHIASNFYLCYCFIIFCAVYFSSSIHILSMFPYALRI